MLALGRRKSLTFSVQPVPCYRDTFASLLQLILLVPVGPHTENPVPLCAFKGSIFAESIKAYELLVERVGNETSSRPTRAGGPDCT